MHAYAQGLRLSRAGRHLEAIACFEEALLLKPDDPATLFALGNTAQALGLNRPAAEFFGRVLAQEPGRIEALVNLANLLRLEGRFDAARALLEPWVARHPDNPDLLLTLGSTWRESGDYERAEQCYRAALGVCPGFAAALSNLADLLADDGDFGTARTLYDRALKASGGDPQIRLNRAILHFLAGNLKDGWRDYAARALVRGKVPICDLKLPEWRGEPLKPQARLLVRAEQGIGDQLMFMSVLPDLLAQGQVILECDPRLVGLAARSFPSALVRPQSLSSIKGAVHAEYGWLKSMGGATNVCLVGSLPRWLRRNLDAFPKDHVFLKSEPAERARWETVFAGQGPRPRIGLCWRSGKSGGHRSAQYAPLSAWGEFLRTLDGTLVCCQYGASEEEIAHLEALSGRRILVPAGLDQKQELDRTAAMLAALDVLASAPTAVAWLGAGLGIPTLKLLHDKSWTTFGQAYEPFAPSCRCVMPGTRGDWNDVFARARAIIAQL
ncbi:MAG: tetratricopeptide repeat protein [Rhizomicrobium sp.]